MSGRYGSRPNLNVHQQCAMMQAVYPDFTSRVTRDKLTCVGTIQPTMRSDVYVVRIEYRVITQLDVKVLDPELMPLEPGGVLKHVYPENRLCLFDPKSGEFEATMSLAKTIVPWASEWLFYYEMWHATGEWLGGGVEPDRSEYAELDGEGQ